MGLYLLVFALTAPFVLGLVADALNLRYARGQSIPEGLQSPEERAKSLQYLAVNTKFSAIESICFWLLQLAFLFFGIYGFLHNFSYEIWDHAIGGSWIFLGLLGVLTQFLSLPFRYYQTFQIEADFGFNRSTKKTFFLDLVKGAFLGILLGGPLLAAVLWFFARFGADAWWMVWIFLAVVQVTLLFVAPLWILPLFNKFTPLGAGPLRSAIEAYAEKEKFVLEGIYTMDGSKRSSKANAFFTGFGKSKRIALFDTLLEKHSIDELVAILAHEVGHYRLGHIPKRFVFSLLSSGIMLYVLSWLMQKPELSQALSVQDPSVGSSLLVASLLYSPIGILFGVFSSWVSRKHEFEADAFARNTSPKPEALAEALKKLGQENLSNLTPHWLKVVLEYSHPPLVERVKKSPRA